MIRKLSAIVVIALAVAACDQSARTAPSTPRKYWLVFFNVNGTAISPHGKEVIAEAAAAAMATPNARVTVTGNTDTDGPADYNMALSLKRANVVKDALVRNGVSVTSITVVGRGKEAPLVETPDNVKAESNRRVEIVVQ